MYIYKFKSGIFILFILLCSLNIKAKNDLKFERLSLNEGAALNLTYCMLQDRQGYIWFGTMYGLVKYDGKSYTIYKNNPDDINSISFDDIISLYEDTQNNLWIGTWGGGLNKFDKKTNKFTRFVNDGNKSGEISDNIIWTICEDDEGNMWFGTETGGLNKYNPESNSFTVYKHLNKNTKSILSNSIRTIYKTNDGKLWIGNRNGISLYNKNSNDFTNYLIKIPENPLNVFTICDDSNDNILIGTSKGLIVFDRKNKRFITNTFPELQNKFIFSICREKGNIIWLGSNQGLYKIESDGAISNYTNEPGKPSSLSGNNIIKVMSDKSGIIWINAYGAGINKLDPNISPFISYSAIANFINNSVNAFCTTNNYNIWIGSSNNLVCFDKKSKILKNYPAEKNNRIFSLSSDEKYIWIGTDRGLELFDYHSMKYEPLPHSIKDNKSLSFFKIAALLDEDHKLFIGTYGSGLYIFDRETGSLKNYNFKDQGLQDHANYVLCFFSDTINPDYIWIGTFGGLIQMNIADNTFKVYRHNLNVSGSLSNDYVLSIKRDSRNILWVGTANGLNKMIEKEKKFFPYYEKDGLPNSVISSIVEDDSGSLWVSTNYGISKFNPESGTFYNYDMKDGLQNNFYFNQSFLKDYDGDIYFGGTRGFDIVQPELFKQSKYIPDVSITSLEIMDSKGIRKNIIPGEKTELNYDENFIRFDFVSLDYKNPSRNLFKYKLLGIDRDWINSGNVNNANYTNLPPGEYHFFVQGSNSSGVFNNTAASIDIIIHPPFWKTLWFNIAAILSGILILYFLYKHKLKQKINNALELEKIRREEGEKLRKKTAADFHDELGHRLTRISLLSEIMKNKIGSSSKELTALLDKISANSYELYEGTRDFIWAIDAQKDSLYELLIRLKDFGDDLFEESDILFEVNGLEEPLLKDKSLTMDWKRHLALIFKEGMNNSLKHANSSKITMDSILNNNNFEIILSDDGTGFIPESKSEGNGIKNMKKRAEKLSAELDIISTPGKGTSIYFRGKIPEQKVLTN